MSCGARLPVYVLLAAVFFPVYGGVAVFGLYLLGILVAIALGLVLKYSLFKDKLQTPFIMELPPYRMPTLRNVWFHMWGRTSAFIRKAWTIIMATSIVLWFLMAIPTDRQSAFAETDIDTSAFATVAGAVAPIFEPLGFGSWEASGALTAGFVAKEVVVSTLAQTYGLTAMEAEATAEPTTFVQDVSLIVTSFGSATLDTLKSIPLIVGINLFAEDEEPLPGALLSSVHRGFEESSGGHGALAALAFMVFVLLYTPCAATIAAARQELGNRWMWFSVLGQFVLAWLGAFIVFQGGLLLGMG
jgi:ferrous iron transport protein B